VRVRHNALPLQLPTMLSGGLAVLLLLELDAACWRPSSGTRRPRQGRQRGIQHRRGRRGHLPNQRRTVVNHRGSKSPATKTAGSTRGRSSSTSCSASTKWSVCRTVWRQPAGHVSTDRGRGSHRGYERNPAASGSRCRRRRASTPPATPAAPPGAGPTARPWTPTRCSTGSTSTHRPASPGWFLRRFRLRDVAFQLPAVQALGDRGATEAGPAGRSVSPPAWRRCVPNARRR
jgi:hypothetical protein